MNKSDIIWWPDDQKGLIINAVNSRDRASPRFVATRAARLILPMPLMVLASYGISSTLTYLDDSPAWVLTWADWAPTIILWVCAVMALFIGSMLFIEWRQASREAAVYESKARDLGVDIAKLDSDWVFEALVLPMVRRKGIQLPDGTISRLQEE